MGLAMTFAFLGQTVPAFSASTIFYLTLLFIFLTAIVTTLVTRYSRDKCLKLFHRYHVTLERGRGSTTWGKLKVFSSGVELLYDHPYTDIRGHRKTSTMLYQADLDNNVLCLLRHHEELSDKQQALREKQVRRTFNPGPQRRAWRSIRNIFNALKDGFNAAFGAIVSQVSRMNPGSAVLTTQANQVTQIGQTLLNKFGNAFEPLLEQYIGRPVIIDIADAINPNNVSNQFTGYLADYTQQWLAVFNVEHVACEKVRLKLPELPEGQPAAALPPLPPPPGIGAPPPVLPPPLVAEQGFEVRLDRLRFKILNTRQQTMVIRRLEREGFEPVEFGAAIPPSGTFDMAARDGRGGTLVIDLVDTIDVIAPRKFATVRHAGNFVDRPGVLDELQLDQLPLIPKSLAGVLGREKPEDAHVVDATCQPKK
jgi:hypothetical protein